MKRTFLERVTESLTFNKDSFEDDVFVQTEAPQSLAWQASEPQEGELAVDVYQTSDTIVVQAMVAGVSAENLSVSVTRDLITIKGRREAPQTPTQENYFHQELYWGAFARTILLPQEVEPEEVEASERHGLLTIKLHKIDKSRVQNIKIKSL